MSSTIVNHPLNPHRILVVKAKKPPQERHRVKEELQTLFVLPLFRDIMVRDKPLVNATRSRSRREMVRHYATARRNRVCRGPVCAYPVSGYAHIARFYEKHQPYFRVCLLKMLRSSNSTWRLVSCRGSWAGCSATMTIRRYPWGSAYRGRPLLRAIKRSYFYRLRRCMVAPAAKYP